MQTRGKTTDSVWDSSSQPRDDDDDDDEDDDGRNLGDDDETRELFCVFPATGTPTSQKHLS